MPADGAVVRAQVGRQVAAMVGAGVARGTVEAAAVPDEPALGHRVEVLAPHDLANRALQADLRQRVRGAIAELTPEDEANGHPPSTLPLVTAIATADRGVRSRSTAPAASRPPRRGRCRRTPASADTA